MMRSGELAKSKNINMKLKLFLLITLLIVISCTNSDNELLNETIEPAVVKNPTKISSQFPILLQSSATSDPNCYFEYNSQGKVTKKIGKIIQGSSSSGLPPYFVNWIYTIVSYNGNSAVMKTHSLNPTFNPLIDEKLFEFDNQGKIIKSIIYAPQYIEWEKHLTYKYNTSGKLVEILTELPNMPYIPTDPNDYILTYIEKFTYDGAGNLQKAITTERHNNTDIYITKSVEFSNFDTVQNPFSNLTVFEDYFYLSLSKNNFQKRKIQEFNMDGQEVFFNELTWANQYNLDGSLKLYY